MHQRLAEAGVGVWEMKGFLLAVTVTKSHAIHCAPTPWSDLPLPVSLKHQHVLASWGSVPQPHTQAAPVATTTLPPTPVHTDASPPAVCLGSQPPTCCGAVPPSPPLPPVSGRQLQLCPLLSEQVDSDAQSHKPWVGMKFLSFTHPLLLFALSPCTPVLLPPFPSHPPTLPFFISLFFVLHILLNSQSDMFFSLPAYKKLLVPRPLNCY